MAGTITLRPLGAIELMNQKRATQKYDMGEKLSNSKFKGEYQIVIMFAALIIPVDGGSTYL
jgi:hypothetical protein